eukprot:9271095-Pyramimonas_sp.AAC.1
MQRYTAYDCIMGLLRARQNCQNMSSQVMSTCCVGLRRKGGITAPSFVTPPATAAKPGDCPVSTSGPQPRPTS